MLPSFPGNCLTCVIGLGYVGLPLIEAISDFLTASGFKSSSDSSHPLLIGFDINEKRIDELRASVDSTSQIDDFNTINNNALFTSSASDLVGGNVFIITVPTPVTKSNSPDLSCLREATITVAHAISESLQKIKNYSLYNPVIIYESTVYPGVTEDFCVPIIESITALKLNEGFYIGYSPERVNPSDPAHKLKDIVKVTSGSSFDSANWINQFYANFVCAGTFKASSILVAEAAKAIENTQRDLNIALINEFSSIFKRLGIKTSDVLAAASTKWNFLDFKPGLVGGHCIGVDPYYLAHCASLLGHNPELILAGRRINDSMYLSIGQEIIKAIMTSPRSGIGLDVLLLGISFKENCSDLRNSQVIRLANYLIEFGVSVHVFDPCVQSSEILHALPSVTVQSEISALSQINFSAVALLLAHEYFNSFDSTIWSSIIKDAFVYDLKGLIPESFSPSCP